MRWAANEPSVDKPMWSPTTTMVTSLGFFSAGYAFALSHEPSTNEVPCDGEALVSWAFWSVKSKNDRVLVFTPFWRHLQHLGKWGGDALILTNKKVSLVNSGGWELGGMTRSCSNRSIRWVVGTGDRRERDKCLLLVHSMFVFLFSAFQLSRSLYMLFSFRLLLFYPLLSPQTLQQLLMRKISLVYNVCDNCLSPWLSFPKLRYCFSSPFLRVPLPFLLLCSFLLLFASKNFRKLWLCQMAQAWVARIALCLGLRLALCFQAAWLALPVGAYLN